MSPLSELNDLPILTPQRPAQPSAEERRIARRVPVELECEERLGPCRYFRVTSDVSPFGLSTRYGYPHEVGTRLQLSLYLPDDPSKPVSLEGEVVGVFPDTAGVRLAFRNPSGEAVRRISRYLQQRATSH